MKRDYIDNVESDAVEFFTGVEVEKTPAFGQRTLFVVGWHPVATIEEKLRATQFHADGPVQHIFFGANHSFDPRINVDDIAAWETMIQHFIKQDMQCSLDIPIALAEVFTESILLEYDNFIPQLRIPIPYIKLWNYNTMIKFDDKDFRATNPGVWCHTLHSAMSRDSFTPWCAYKKDTPL
jgi:hypothetical protein